MPAPILGSLITYISEELEVSVWDGEVPRQSTDGTAINQAGGNLIWPAINAVIKPPGFERSYTFEEAYLDDGDVTVQIWAVQRSQVQTMMNRIEVLLAPPNAWGDISATLGGMPTNPYYIVQMELMNWAIESEEGKRLNFSDLLYRGDMRYNIQIHGALSLST